jgi:hypothetical protein
LLDDHVTFRNPKKAEWLLLVALEYSG